MHISSRYFALAIVVGTTLLLPASPIFAGHFAIVDVWYDYHKDDFAQSVWTYAHAKFRGKPTPADDDWNIQTYMNDTSHSTPEDLHDWDGPYWHGQGASGTDWRKLANGYDFLCDEQSCAAQASIPYCDATEEDVTYLGNGKVWFNIWNPRNVNSKDGPRESTQCKFSIGGTVTGLERGESIVLANNGADTVTVDYRDSEFVFSAKVASRKEYNVEITQQPENGKRCSIAPGTESEIVKNRDITTIKVSCTTTCQATVYPVPDPGDLAAAGASHCKTPQLVDMDGFTVADYANNLLWTKDFVGTYAVWPKDARKMCGDLVMGGREDWRVPDVAQLQTLLPNCQSLMSNCNGGENPAGERFAYIYWSSSVYKGNPDGYNTCGNSYLCYWVVGFGEGWGYGLDSKYDSEAAYTRCVTTLVP